MILKLEKSTSRCSTDTRVSASTRIVPRSAVPPSRGVCDTAAWTVIRFWSIHSATCGS